MTHYAYPSTGQFKNVIKKLLLLLEKNQKNLLFQLLNLLEL